MARPRSGRASSGPIYCIDSSSIIDCWVRFYRPSAFVGVWEVLDELIERKRLISPRGVQDELLRGERPDQGELRDWINDRDGMFIDPDRAQESAVREMTQRVPGLVKTGKLRRGADPWVVALASSRGCTVVTEEGLKGVSIPTLCRAMRVDQIDVSELVCTQGCRFVRDQ